MTRGKEQPGSARQWWLSEGSEVCSFCEALVHPEMLGYCLVCDQSICYLCSRETGSTCPQCAREQQSNATKEQA